MTCDTSQTYLLFQTLLLLFWLHSCTIWTKLTRTDAVFSKAVVAVFVFQVFRRIKVPKKFQKNYIKFFLDGSLQKHQGRTPGPLPVTQEGGWRGPEGGSARHPTG